MFHQFSDRECLTFDLFSKGLSITKGAKLIPPLPARYKRNKCSNIFPPLHSAAQKRRGHARASMKSEKTQNVQFFHHFPIDKTFSQEEFRSSEGQNTKNGNDPMDNQQPQDLFLRIFKPPSRSKPHLTKFDGFIRNFDVYRKTNKNQILEAGRGK